MCDQCTCLLFDRPPLFADHPIPFHNHLLHLPLLPHALSSIPVFPWRDFSLSLDATSNISYVSAPVVFRRNLPSIFNKSGLQCLCVLLRISTTDGAHCSQMDLVISYGLPSNVVLGPDCATPCWPLFINNHSFVSKPAPETIDLFPPTHSWKSVNGSSVCFLIDASLLRSPFSYSQPRTTHCILPA